MKLFTAKDARTIVDQFKKAGLNYARKKTLKSIQDLSSNGKDILILDDPYLKLNEDDYNYFEELGYIVTRDKIEILIPSGMTKEEAINSNKIQQQIFFGMISWEK